MLYPASSVANLRPGRQGAPSPGVSSRRLRFRVIAGWIRRRYSQRGTPKSYGCPRLGYGVLRSPFARRDVLRWLYRHPRCGEGCASYPRRASVRLVRTLPATSPGWGAAWGLYADADAAARLIYRGYRTFTCLLEYGVQVAYAPASVGGGASGESLLRCPSRCQWRSLARGLAFRRLGPLLRPARPHVSLMRLFGILVYTSVSCRC